MASNAPDRPAPRGWFITFEGGEGSGKSTQLARLAERLRAWLGRPDRVLTLREPGGTALGEELRTLLKTPSPGRHLHPAAELLLFAASRAQLVRETIVPALAAGTVVLCDRFADSTTVYQGVARHLDPAVVATINGFAVDGCRPDLTLLFDLSVPAARRRLRGRVADSPALLEDRLDAEGDPFFERVRAGYRELAAAEPDRFIVLDADRPADAIAGSFGVTFRTVSPMAFSSLPRV